MSRLVESIKIENGKLLNIDFHNERMARTMNDLFKKRNKVDLEKIIILPKHAMQGIFKCRLVYDEKTTVVEFLPYILKPVRSLKLVQDNDISYSYKFLDRTRIDKLFNLRGFCDDILIIKNGMVTDSSYSNAVFKDSAGKWFTPSTYLLPGTMRAKLLNNNLITEIDVCISDIHNYKEARLINAMRGIDDSEDIPISQIFL